MLAKSGTVDPTPAQAPILDEVTVFVVPRTAWEAINGPCLADTVEGDGFDWSDDADDTAPVAGVRISCRVAIAFRLAQAWRLTSERVRFECQLQLDADAASAAINALEAIRGAMMRTDRLWVDRFRGRASADVTPETGEGAPPAR